MLRSFLYTVLFMSLLLMGLSVRASQPNTQTVTITARYLNVREASTTNSAILTVVRRGESYPVIGQSGTWWQIQVGSMTGWVSGRYVIANGYNPVTSAPVINTPVGTACPATLFFGSSTDGICPGAIMTTQAAYQSYQHGFMVWLADSGDIWVFMNGSLAPWLHFRQRDYANYADATGQSPAGLILPVNGFGRVSANSNDFHSNKVKDKLGWATASEVAYSATWQFYGRTSHTHTYISLPDGSVVDAYSGLAGISWALVK